MWRSIVRARRCAVALHQSATSQLTTQVQSFNINWVSSLKPCTHFYSSLSADHDNESKIESFGQIPEKIDEFGENPVSIEGKIEDLDGNPVVFEDKIEDLGGNLETHFDSDGKIESFGGNAVSIEDLDGNPVLVEDKIEDLGGNPESIDEFGENPVLVSSELSENVVGETGEVGVKEVDLEQLESVLSLLQSSGNSDEETNLSLDRTLDEMNLTSLSEEFVVRVLETPLVPGEKLIGFYKWAMKNTESFSPTSRSLEALVKAISAEMKKKSAYAALDLIKEIGENGNDGVLATSILNRLMSLLSKLGKGKAVHDVYEKFDDFGCVPNSDTYYYTIEALCRRSFYDWVCPVVEKMIGSSILPEKERVGKIILLLCKGQKVKEAHSVYLLAKEKDKSLPKSSVNFLISSLSRNDETVRLGLAMLSDFSGEERKFAIKPFSSVIRGLCRIKDVGTAKDLLSKMIEEGPPPGNSVFNSIINGLSKAGDMGEAKEMMKSMESRGLKPDVFTYTVIMSGYVKGGEMEEACKVLEDAKAKHSKLSTVTYHTLVRGYCKLGEFDKAVNLLREMKEFGVEPNVDEYNKLIQSLCLKALDWGTAEKLMEEMKENGLHLNGTTKALLRAVKEVEIEGDAGSVGDGGEETVALAA